jgi:hypothetical protein
LKARRRRPTKTNDQLKTILILLESFPKEKPRMKNPPRFVAASFWLALALVVLPVSLRSNTVKAAASVQTTTADTLQRGYRTGYSDGYQTGWRDTVEGRARDYRGKDDYRRADRVYVAAYGSLEDYRDGYRQGFESGYAAGYDKRGFDSTVPTNLRRRETVADAATTDDTDDGVASRRNDDSTNQNIGTANRDADVDDRQASDSAARNRNDDGNASGSNTSGRRGTTSLIPADTMLRVELLNRLSSDVSQRGDRFEARVIEPREYEGAIVSGRVTRVRRAPKVRGTSELQLDFDQIRFVNGPWADFNAQVVEVIPVGGEEQVGDVDPEGGVRGRSSTKDDVAKVGATAGVGAIIGAIAGGGKGAAIGAAIGGAVGTGGVLTQRGKDIQFERGQQLRIRTTGDTRTQ